MNLCIHKVFKTENITKIMDLIKNSLLSESSRIKKIFKYKKTFL